jgi:hypothetical protein
VKNGEQISRTPRKLCRKTTINPDKCNGKVEMNCPVIIIEITSTHRQMYCNPRE